MEFNIMKCWHCLHGKTLVENSSFNLPLHSSLKTNGPPLFIQLVKSIKFSKRKKRFHIWFKKNKDTLTHFLKHIKSIVLSTQTETFCLIHGLETLTLKTL